MTNKRMEPETLQTISQAAVALGIFLTGLGGYGAYHFGNKAQDKKDGIAAENLRKAQADSKEKDIKLDILTTQQEKSNQILDRLEGIAIQTFPNIPKQEAVDKLIERINHTEKEVASEKEKRQQLTEEFTLENKLIKSFSASIRVKFSGNWSTPPYAASLMGTRMNLLLFIDKQQQLPPILFGNNTANFQKTGDSSAIFIANLNTLPNDPAIGKTLMDLKKYDQMTLRIPIHAENLLDKRILIEQVSIQFTVNQIQKGEVNGNTPFFTEISTEGGSFFGFDIVPTRNNLMKELKFIQ